MVGVVSCSSPTSAPEQAAVPHHECYWKGDGVTGSPKIHISLSEQCVRYFKGGQLVGMSPISSGREGHSTRRGTFKVIEKDLNHRSTLYGAFVDADGYIVQEDVDVRKDKPPAGARFVGAEMPGFMRITGAIGMHAGYLPGYPASHGCIRLPAHMAEVFYHATPHGTPVVIEGNAADAPVRPPVVVATPTENKTKKKGKTRNTPLGQTRYLGQVDTSDGQANAATVARAAVTVEADDSAQETAKPRPQTRAQSAGIGILGGGRKKAAKPLRGQTLYLEE